MIGCGCEATCEAGEWPEFEAGAVLSDDQVGALLLHMSSAASHHVDGACDGAVWGRGEGGRSGA